MPADPMAAEHRQTIEGMFAAFTRGDMAAVLDCYADDVDYGSSRLATGLSINYAQAAGVPWLQRRQGKAAVAQHLGAVGELEITDFAILGFLSGDNTVIVQVVIQAKWTPTGFTFHDEELQYFQFNGAGKIIKTRHYLDTAKHMAAAGLQPHRCRNGAPQRR